MKFNNIVGREFYRVRFGRFQFMLESLPLDMIGIRYMFLRGMTIKGFIALEAFHNIEIGLLLLGITINITDNRASKSDPDISEESNGEEPQTVSV